MRAAVVARGGARENVRGEGMLDLCWGWGRGDEGTGDPRSFEGADLISQTFCLTAHPYSYPLPNQ
jgi:hypothetical protein